MISLLQTNLKYAHEVYREERYFFPLIAAVLLGKQDGLVFANDADIPTQFFVEHAFGFSQIFGQPDHTFLKALEIYLLKEKNFWAPKIRLYAPEVPPFLAESCSSVELSWRQRFISDTGVFEKSRIAISKMNLEQLELVYPGKAHLVIIDSVFNVVDRFWRNREDFVNKACPCVVYYEGIPASICYAAASADGKAEIDVLTSARFRNLGLGKLAVYGFNQKCSESDISPLWDCFANNSPSMRMAESCGFIPCEKPYSFFTINK